MCRGIPHLVVPVQSQLIDKLSLESFVFNGINAEANTNRKFNNPYQSDAPDSLSAFRSIRFDDGSTVFIYSLFVVVKLKSDKPKLHTGVNCVFMSKTFNITLMIHVQQSTTQVS